MDGPVVTSWWAQPSGIDEMDDGTLAIADSESSAIRLLDPQTLTVRTVVGKGLFDFGHVDGSSAAPSPSPSTVSATEEGERPGRRRFSLSC